LQISLEIRFSLGIRVTLKWSVNISFKQLHTPFQVFNYFLRFFTFQIIGHFMKLKIYLLFFLNPDPLIYYFTLVFKFQNTSAISNKGKLIFFLKISMSNKIFLLCIICIIVTHILKEKLVRLVLKFRVCNIFVYNDFFYRYRFKWFFSINMVLNSFFLYI
jgi:hypothetical protein